MADNDQRQESTISLPPLIGKGVVYLTLTQSVAFDRSAIQPLVEPQCGSRENILPYIPHLSISAEGKMPSQNVENPRQFKTNETVANAS
jgi:hypothetical protein